MKSSSTEKWKISMIKPCRKEKQHFETVGKPLISQLNYFFQFSQNRKTAYYLVVVVFYYNY